MVSDVDDMVARLRGVLDDVERAAKAATPGPWYALDGGVINDDNTQWPVSETESDRDRDDRVHIARHNPKHVLNVVAAHRRILELHGDQHECPGSPGAAQWPPQPCATLQALATGYADRDGLTRQRQ